MKKILTSILIISSLISSINIHGSQPKSLWPWAAAITGGLTALWVGKHWYNKYQIYNAKQTIKKTDAQVGNAVGPTISGERPEELITALTYAQLRAKARCYIAFNEQTIQKRWRERNLVLSTSLGLVGLGAAGWGIRTLLAQRNG